MTETAPFSETFTATVPAAAAGAAAAAVICAAPFAGVVTSVQYIPVGGITGHDTNTRTVSVVNKGQSGSGTTKIAELAFVASTNATANDATTVPLSGTAANLVVAAGDVVSWASAFAASGTADPGGVVVLTIGRS